MQTISLLDACFVNVPPHRKSPFSKSRSGELVPYHQQFPHCLKQQRTIYTFKGISKAKNT